MSITAEISSSQKQIVFAPPQAICEQIVWEVGETLEIFCPVKNYYALILADRLIREDLGERFLCCLVN